MQKTQVVKILRKIRDIDAEINLQQDMQQTTYIDLQRFKDDVMQAMIQLPYKQKDVLWSHYVKGEQWEKVRRRHHYSERQIRNIGNTALQALGALLEDNKTIHRFIEKENR